MPRMVRACCVGRLTPGSPGRRPPAQAARTGDAKSPPQDHPNITILGFRETLRSLCRRDPLAGSHHVGGCRSQIGPKGAVMRPMKSIQRRPARQSLAPGGPGPRPWAVGPPCTRVHRRPRDGQKASFSNRTGASPRKDQEPRARQAPSSEGLPDGKPCML